MLNIRDQNSEMFGPNFRPVCLSRFAYRRCTDRCQRIFLTGTEIFLFLDRSDTVTHLLYYSATSYSIYYTHAAECCTTFHLRRSLISRPIHISIFTISRAVASPLRLYVIIPQWYAGAVTPCIQRRYIHSAIRNNDAGTLFKSLG